MRLSGLEGPVEVYRDPEGVPHVWAGSVHDAFFGQGFVHARDRLWHMEYDRRRGSGRWAELAGPPGLAQDLFLRCLNLPGRARADYEHLAAETRAMLEAYAAGVNAWLSAAPRRPMEFSLLGLEPEPWQPWDSLVVFKVRHVDMGPWQLKLWRARLLRQVGPVRAAALCPGLSAESMVIVPPGTVDPGPGPDGRAVFEAAMDWLADVACLEPAGAPAAGAGRREPVPPDAGEAPGSNSWVLAGCRTASGRPLLAGDPHRWLEVPTCYYPNHVACPDFDAIGLSFPGVPGFPHFGHTARVAWCVTHTQADTQDLYVERFDAGGVRYEFAGGWREAVRRRERILVRGTTPVDLEVVETHHGPVVFGEPASGRAITWRSTATAAPDGTFDAFLPMLRARSATELEEAVRPWVDPVNNLLFADVDGAIGFRVRGRVPLRAAANAWVPVPGWDGAHEWQGAVPFEGMPALRDPEAGFIVTANGRVTGQACPYHLGLDFAPDFRTRRIVTRLRDLRGATVEDMKAIHADRVSLPARELLEALRLRLGDPRAALRARGADGLAVEALGRLLGWDGTMEAEALEPALYAAFRDRLLADLLTPLLGPLAPEAFAGSPRGGVAHVARLRSRLATMVRHADPTLLPPGAAWPDVLVAAWQAAVAALAARLGPDLATWRWGRLHRAAPRHPLSPLVPEAARSLDPPAIAVGGDGDTVQAAGYIPGLGFEVTLTSVARYVFDLGDWERSGWVVPLGVSGDPESPHYADQQAAWAACRLFPMRYARARVVAEARTQEVLEPA